MLPCWAPRRVESTGDELFTLLIMASLSSNSKVSQNKPKRPRENASDTPENEHSQPTMSTASPRFLVIHSQEERTVSSLSPFVIQKVLNGMAGEPGFWLVGCFGFSGPLRQNFSLYRAVSQREGERGERIEESKNIQTTPHPHLLQV